MKLLSGIYLIKVEILKVISHLRQIGLDKSADKLEELLNELESDKGQDLNQD